MLLVFALPDFVLLVPGGFFASEDVFVLLDVGDGFPDVLLGLLEGLGGVVSELGVGHDLGVVVVDVGVQVVQDLAA